MPRLTDALPPPLVAQARLFLRWWGRELAAIVPDSARRLARPVPRAEIRTGRNGVTIDRESESLGERLHDPRALEALDEEGWSELAALIRDTRTRLILSAPDVFTMRLTLPAAARSRLRSAVALQLRHAAPIEPELLAWDFALVDRDRATLTVRVAMARADRIAQIRGLFEDRGIAPPPIVAFDDEREIELMPGADGSLTPERRQWRRAAAIAAALAASVPLTTWSAANLMVLQEEGRTRTLHEALAPRLAEDQARAREEPVRRALKTVFELPSASSLIEGLALGLPDSAFATGAERRYDGRFTFEAETTDRAALESALSDSALLSGVHPADAAADERGHVLLSFAGDPR